MSATITSPDGLRDLEVDANGNIGVVQRDASGAAVVDASVVIKDAPANVAASAQPVITVDPSGNYIAPGGSGGGASTSDAAGRGITNTLGGDRWVAQRHNTVLVDFIYGIIDDQVLLENLWDYTGTALVAGEVVDGVGGALGIIDEVTGSVIRLEVLRGPFSNGDAITGRTSGGTGTIASGLHQRPATVDGKLTLQSGSLVEKTEVYSRGVLPFVPGRSVYATMQLGWSLGGAVGLWAYGGALNGSNGFGIGYLDAAFGVVRRRLVGGVAVDTFAPQASWSVDRLDGTGPSGITLDAAMINTFRFSMCHQSNTLLWEVLGVDRNWHLFHVLTGLNTESAGIVHDPHTPLRVEVGRNTANASNVSIETLSWAGGIVGTDRNRGRPVVSVVQKPHLGGTNDLPLITLKNPLTFNGVRNRSPLSIELASLGSVGGKGVIFKFWKNANLIGAVFADYRTGQRFTQVDTSATAVAGGELVDARVMRDKSGRDIEGTDIMTITPGETLTVTGVSEQAADLIVSITAREGF